MARKPFAAYQNECDCIELQGLTIENRIDRISVYGSIDLTLDKQGLAATRILKEIIDQTLVVLERTDLPDRVELQPVETIDNPFA
jgi:hypothetical protein